MRIRGQGSQGGGLGHDHETPRQRERRVAAFRAEHRVGQRVTGTVLGWRAPGLAWVDLGGHRLLASIATDPAPGQAILFEVTALTPAVTLREIHAKPLSGMHDSPMGRLVAAYLAARTRLDSLMAGLGTGRAASSRDGYLAALAAKPEAALAFAEAAHLAAGLNEAMAGAARLAPAPWLAPAAREVDLLHHQAEGKAQLDLGFDLPGLGRGQARFMRLGDARSLKVLLERPAMAPAAKDLLRRLAPRGWDYVGAAPLPPRPLGLLSTIFRPAPRPYGGGFAARV